MCTYIRNETLKRPSLFFQDLAIRYLHRKIYYQYILFFDLPAEEEEMTGRALLQLEGDEKNQVLDLLGLLTRPGFFLLQRNAPGNPIEMTRKRREIIHLSNRKNENVYLAMIKRYIYSRIDLSFDDRYSRMISRTHYTIIFIFLFFPVLSKDKLTQFKCLGIPVVQSISHLQKKKRKNKIKMSIKK